jgi:hypothetical protein
MIGTLEIIIILLGFIGFPLILWLICFWVDHSDDYIGRACRKANRNHYEWEKEQRRKRK